ncbi:MAG: SH3 domain-containing C40 family peptidase [Candidatus Aminicenantes bacterium]|nr:SH3 domain-containing C40 family peptidase [Candidatus Aminicenantes bacterium]
MMKTPTVIVLLVVLAGLAFPAVQKPAGPAAAVVINAVENMHSRSTSSTDVVSQALLGENVTILKKERNSDGEDWYQVETPDTYKGWVISSALRFLKPGEKPYASSGKIFVVTALLANTYREPDVTKHKPVKVAPISVVLEVVGERDARWLEVSLPCNTRVWIQRGDGEVREAPMVWPRTSLEDMVALSKRFIGLPYFWGGTSPLGLDCSGFVQLIYKMSGVPILRDADIQLEGSGLVEVVAGAEAAGDLVFFGSAKNKIGHVGMMIDAEEFINATVHEKPIVQISRLKDAYWQKIYQGARRAK